MQVKKQQLELDMEKQNGSKLGTEKQTGSKLRMESIKALYCHPAYLT